MEEYLYPSTESLTDEEKKWVFAEDFFSHPESAIDKSNELIELETRKISVEEYSGYLDAQLKMLQKKVIEPLQSAGMALEKKGAMILYKNWRFLFRLDTAWSRLLYGGIAARLVRDVKPKIRTNTSYYSTMWIGLGKARGQMLERDLRQPVYEDSTKNQLGGYEVKNVCNIYIPRPFVETAEASAFNRAYGRAWNISANSNLSDVSDKLTEIGILEIYFHILNQMRELERKNTEYSCGFVYIEYPSKYRERVAGLALKEFNIRDGVKWVTKPEYVTRPISAYVRIINQPSMDTVDFITGYELLRVSTSIHVESLISVSTTDPEATFRVDRGFAAPKTVSALSDKFKEDYRKVEEDAKKLDEEWYEEALEMLETRRKEFARDKPVFIKDVKTYYPLLEHLKGEVIPGPDKETFFKREPEELTYGWVLVPSRFSVSQGSDSGFDSELDPVLDSYSSLEERYRPSSTNEQGQYMPSLDELGLQRLPLPNIEELDDLYNNIDDIQETISEFKTRFEEALLKKVGKRAFKEIISNENEFRSWYEDITKKWSDMDKLDDNLAIDIFRAFLEHKYSPQTLTNKRKLQDTVNSHELSAKRVKGPSPTQKLMDTLLAAEQPSTPLSSQMPIYPPTPQPGPNPSGYYDDWE